MYWRLKMLTKEEVDNFKKIAFEVYGIRLTGSQALDQGSRLIKLFELLVKSKRELAFKPTILNKKVLQSNKS